jgi:hypothetical protein
MNTDAHRKISVGEATMYVMIKPAAAPSFLVFPSLQTPTPCLGLLEVV